MSPAAYPVVVRSRDNPLVKDWRRWVQGGTDYRRHGRFWVEGEHLVRAATARGVQPLLAIFSESFWPVAQSEYGHLALKNMIVSDALFDAVSALESPARMGFVFGLPAPQPVRAGLDSVVLDQVQDAGNVGAILRSASAFGFRQVLALKGTAGLWSPKVLRSAMGAHWGLHLVEAADVSAVDAIGLPVLVTSSHQGAFLHQMVAQAALASPCVWAFGHEGQGVGAALQARAACQVRIAQPGGEESLNVGAAAAICLHASACLNLG